MAADRRTQIADAVITVLADRGSRGLTHRAVDEEAGLPAGSTSYYFRSRAELLAAAVPRLAELDAAALARDGGPLHQLTEVLSSSLRDRGRRRTLARYELVLEGARRPEIHAALAAGTENLIALLTGLFPDSPPEEARTRARDVLAFVDGMLLAHVTAPTGRRTTTDELSESLRRVLPLD